MSGDSYFNYVVLGLAGDSFTDFSNYANPITNAGVSLTNQYPGVLPTSWAFADPTPAVLAYARLPAAAQVKANQDFTLECSAFITQPNENGGTLLSTRIYDTNVSGIYLGYTGDGTVFVRATHLGQIVVEIDATAYLTLTQGALHSFSINRVGGQWTLYIDGSAISDIAHTSYYAGAIDVGNNLFIGGDGLEPNLVGGISEIRFTVGYCRYTSPYVPAVNTFPTYYSADGVAPSAFGNLANSISISGASFTSLVSISGIDSGTITVTSASGTVLVGGWTLTILASNQCLISGVAPIPLITYLVNVTAVVPSQYGGGTNTHTYKITNTATGALDSGQSLITQLPGLALWLDSSESSTIVSNSITHGVTQLLDRSGGIVFSPIPGATPVLDYTSWNGQTSIAFSNVSVSGLGTITPIVVSDVNSASTIFLVGKYSGAQLGQGAGNFTLGYGPDSVLADGVSSWDIVTNAVGMPASICAYDNGVIENSITTGPILNSGQKFLVVWKSTTNQIQIYVDQVLVSTTVLKGTVNVWNSVYAAIGFIGGAIAPNGAFVSIGEIIAFKTLLDDPTIIQLESYLNHKWSLYTAIPFAGVPDTLVGYAGDGYQAHVIMTDATSVSVSGDYGTGWTIVPSGTGVPNQYLITAHMPAVIGYVSMTITSYNGAIPGVNIFTISVVALPDVPLITPPTNAACQVNSGYVGLVEILHATTVSVTASEGTNWIISPFVSGLQNYKITGIMPGAVGILTLTIIAVGPSGTTTVQTTIAATPNQISLVNQYQIDLTGALPANLISNEKQTLSAINGMANQLIRPILAPFFSHDFILQYYGVGSVLTTAVKGTDYYPIYELQEMSQVASYHLYGAVRVVNPAITGTVFITYQALGGNWATNKPDMSTALVYAQTAPAGAPWSRIIHNPTYYPVNDHPLNVQTEVVGYSGLVAAIDAIASSAATLNLANDVPAMLSHMSNNANPHALTKAQIGLGNVQNYPLATASQAIAGGLSTAYLTPHTAYLTSLAFMPAATTSVLGTSVINDGSTALLGSNATEYLSAAAIRNLATAQGGIATYLNTEFILANGSSTANALVSVIAPAMKIGQISPPPGTWPVWWRSKKYTDLLTLVTDISAFVSMSVLQYSPTGMIWFPPEITVPNLITSYVAPALGSLPMSVSSNVSQPLVTTF